ncbi:MAG: SLBB domain-containing protein [Desulfobacterota bacterium]|nr:SLBB domain-containing protein [Thermodesulfobacteriota bacterium]MDW8002462.1 NADH-ubiquinone oxidoreductase-F iron-sulfur binding region domain-containing protein [Deltaproteobacteria bacterium]
MRFEKIKREAERYVKDLSLRTHILVGTPTCGKAAGADEVVRELSSELKRRGIEIPVLEVGCMGLCFAEPLVLIFKPGSFNVVYRNVDSSSVRRLVEGYIEGDDPCLELALGTIEFDEEGAPIIPELKRFEFEKRILLRRCGIVDPTNIMHYIGVGGYSALEKTLHLPREMVIDEIKKSELRGRGGAGFPTGIKWEECAKMQDEPKYVICNADEGDPGAFMDRIILESDPHQMLEGMIIAGYAVNANEGFIYVRAEYQRALEMVRRAKDDAERLGILGKSVMGTEFSFNIQVIEGAGAFVAGEETGLIFAIEGKRSEPRFRPPYPSERGLFGKPTLVDNVKTFSYVPWIIENGWEKFYSIGTEKSKGTAIFTLAGKVKEPGLTEVPMGVTLNTLVYEVAGGPREGKRIKAIQIGGPSGGCIPSSLFHLPVDYDAFLSSGSMMGSGGMIFMDEDDCVVDMARFFLDFIQKESCGKCTMCRIGTLQLFYLLDKITKGEAETQDLTKLKELAEDVKIGSLCGLGRSAPNPILTTLRYFYDEYVAHVEEKKCPALVCKSLIAYFIIPEKCDRACEHCKLTCPVEAVGGNKGEPKYIIQEKCVKCGTCLNVCPPEYSAVIKVSPIKKLKELEIQNYRKE